MVIYFDNIFCYYASAQWAHVDLFHPFPSLPSPNPISELYFPSVLHSLTALPTFLIKCLRPPPPSHTPAPTLPAHYPYKCAAGGNVEYIFLTDPQNFMPLLDQRWTQMLNANEAKYQNSVLFRGCWDMFVWVCACVCGCFLVCFFCFFLVGQCVDRCNLGLLSRFRILSV